MADQSPAADTPPKDQPPTEKPAEHTSQESPRLRCERIIREIYGYGIPKSKAIAEQLSDKTIGDVVSLDKRKQRLVARRMIDEALTPKAETTESPAK